MDLPSPSSEILIRADFPVLDIGIFDPQRGGARVTAGYDILFEQKFVCSLERSSRTVCNFLNSSLGLVLTDFRQLIEYPRYR